ncbi:transposable element Tcb1 transposase [Trichonephila clavipes]|nr:transposable element Tcb1 transposase [Trichonephila clavipes]
MWAAKLNEVIFTDESRICRQHHNGRIRLWIHRGDRLLKSCVMHNHTGAEPGIMVWCDIGNHSRTPEHSSSLTPPLTHPAATTDELWQHVEAAWSAIPPKHIESLLESMPGGVAMVISNNGGYSGY